MKVRSLAWLLVSCCLAALFPTPAAAAATVQVELGEAGSYGVQIPFTPSPRTERYTFSILEDGAEVFRAGVSASGDRSDIYLPFAYDPSGLPEYTLRAVSYTHLDVYKRQARRCAGTSGRRTRKLRSSSR